jgi:hypothetical protein
MCRHTTPVKQLCKGKRSEWRDTNLVTLPPPARAPNGQIQSAKHGGSGDRSAILPCFVRRACNQDRAANAAHSPVRRDDGIAARATSCCRHGSVRPFQEAHHVLLWDLMHLVHRHREYSARCASAADPSGGRIGSAPLNAASFSIERTVTFACLTCSFREQPGTHTRVSGITVVQKHCSVPFRVSVCLHWASLLCSLFRFRMHGHTDDTSWDT